MAIFSLNIPYRNFEIGNTIDPSEFNANNGAIQTKVNEVINQVNSIQIINDDGDIVIPSYIKETYIDPIEIKSPLLTGNTFIGASGIVGMSAVGTTNDSVRFWAGSSDKNNAPFQVLHDGTVKMSKSSIETNSTSNGSKIVIQNDYFKLQKNGSDMVTISNTNSIATFIMRSDWKYEGNTQPSSIRVTPTYITYDNGKDFTALLGHGFSDEHGRVGSTFGKLDLFNDNSSRTLITADPLYASYFVGKVAIGKRTADYTLDVKGSLNLTGDIYINGVKMQLTPA